MRLKIENRGLVLQVFGLLFTFFLFSFIIGKSSDPKPFTLTYPAYFGSRFTIPEDNPLTEEGVELGRMLF